MSGGVRSRWFDGSLRPGVDALGSGPPSGPPRVLCVDDEPHILSGLERVLGFDFEVVTRVDPLAALSVLERDGDFAVVIADVNMPEMDGLTFLEAVKSMSPTTTRLALTGSTTIRPATLMPEAVFRVINKPCPPELMQQHVADAVAYHELLARSPAQPVEAAFIGRQPSPDGSLLLPPEGPPSARAARRRPAAGLVDLARQLASSISIEERAPAPFVMALGRERIGLQVEGRTVELLAGNTVVGRSRTCHIPLDDPSISRRHACFMNTGRGVVLQNLSATNGVWVNDTLLGYEQACPLQIGDHVRVGPHDIEFCALGDYSPSLEPTRRFPIEPVPGEPEVDSPTLSMLADVANKYFLLGHAREAERIARPLLEGLLRHCEGGRTPVSSDLELAVNLALRIAESSHAGEWVNYVFDLLSAVQRTPAPEVVERLYRITPDLRGISMASFRGYVETLVRIQQRLGPSERFVVRRIQGLETRLMMSAHL